MTEFRTKGKGDNKKVYPINKRKSYTVDRNLTYEDLKNPGVTPSKLEKEAWNILDKISRVSSVDQLLLSMKKKPENDSAGLFMIGMDAPKGVS